MAKIYGELEVAQFENVSSDPSTGLVSGRAIFNTTTKKGKLYDGVRWVELGAGGQGGINYIDNYSAETNLDGWDDIDYGSVDDPDDSFTGTATNFVMSRLTSGQLREDASFRISKGAADAQGEAQYYAFTLDKADLHSMMEISFDMVCSTNLTDGLLAVFLQHSDDGFTTSTNISVISESGDESLMAKSNGKYKGYCQTHHTNTAYRLVIICRDTSSNTWTFDIDNIKVSPVDNSFKSSGVVGLFVNHSSGGSLTADTAFNLTNVVTDSKNGYSSGVYTFQESGFYNVAAMLSATVSAHRNIKIFKTPFGGSRAVQFDNWETGYSQHVSANMIWYDKGDAIDITMGTSVTIDSYVPGNYLSINKINGLLESGSGGVIACDLRGNGSGNQSIGDASPTKVTLLAATSDTSGAWDATNDKYVVSESGWYYIDFNAFILDADTDITQAIASIYVNGAEVSRGVIDDGGTNLVAPRVSKLTYLNKDDYIEFYVEQDNADNDSNDLYDDPEKTYAAIFKLGGNSTPVISEKINSKHVLTSPSSCNGSQTDLVWGTVRWDTHGHMNTSNGDVTIKETGKYKFAGRVTCYAASGQLPVGGYVYISMHKNGTMVDSSFHGNETTGTHGYFSINFEFWHELEKDDVIDFKIQGYISGAISITDPATPGEDGILLIEKI